MTEPKIYPPPPITTPREAPWREIEEIIEGQKTLIKKIDALIEAISPIIIPPPEGPPTDVTVLLKDLNVSMLALDIRSFLIILYRLGRAREVRLFDYDLIDALGTAEFPYTIPSEYVYVPHIEEVNLGLQRVMTRYDYEGGNLINTETFATDRTVEWTMTPLSRIIEGSFEIKFYNDGATDTWIKYRFLGSLMLQSDYLLWQRLVREISRKYLAFTA